MKQQMQQLPENFRRTQELEEAKKRHKDEDEAEEDQPPPQPATPPAQPVQQAQPGPRPFMPQQPPDQVGGQPPASGEGGQQVKSPEQLLEQLRRMQQPGNLPPDAR